MNSRNRPLFGPVPRPLVRPGPEAHAPLAIHWSPHLGDFPRPRRLFRGNAIKYNYGILGAILDTDILPKSWPPTVLYAANIYNFFGGYTLLVIAMNGYVGDVTTAK